MSIVNVFFKKIIIIIFSLSFISCNKDKPEPAYYYFDNDSVSSKRKQFSNQDNEPHVSQKTPNSNTSTINDDSDNIIIDDSTFYDDVEIFEENESTHNVTHFLVFGDAGTGGEKQYKTAQAMKTICDSLGCDFALYLGDVIYNTGVLSSEDSQFQTKFEQPYSDLDFPFYITVGNHDALGNLSAMVEYSSKSEKFKLPSLFYNFERNNINFYALNTNSLDDDQANMLKNADSVSVNNWKVAFGHHPYKSNGLHGDATWSRKEFYEQHLCNRIDIFFAGHDHDKQHLKSECGIRLFISGAAGGIREVETKENTLFAKSSYGFGWVKIDNNVLNFKFFDENAREEYNYVESK